MKYCEGYEEGVRAIYETCSRYVVFDTSLQDEADRDFIVHARDMMVKANNYMLHIQKENSK